jgi:hypothetical protein
MGAILRELFEHKIRTQDTLRLDTFPASQNQSDISEARTGNETGNNVFGEDMIGCTKTRKPEQLHTLRGSVSGSVLRSTRAAGRRVRVHRVRNRFHHTVQ